MHLVRPSEPYLPSYAAALERGWSPDNVRPDPENPPMLPSIRGTSVPPTRHLCP
jgi:hypothetical protein